jgi:hypothetical protein
VNVLRLQDWGVKRVMREHGLKAKDKLGRGAFTAVYAEDDATVLKLTVDPIQYDAHVFLRDNPHFPTVFDPRGEVGNQHAQDLALYLSRCERLRPLNQADAPTRRLARQVTKASARCWVSARVYSVAKGYARESDHFRVRTLETFSEMSQDMAFPQSLRDAFEVLANMVSNYGEATLDMHRGNLMVRGTDELVLNDVLAPCNLLK